MPSRRRSRPGGALRSVAPESRGSAASSRAAGAGRGAEAARGAGPRISAAAGRTGGPGRGAEPLRVLVDGRNVQHALARELGSSLPTAALVAQLRAAFSPTTQVELILDGHAGRGPQGRVAPGLAVVFSKGATADEIIGNRVSEAFRDLGPVEAWSVIVVTDDREVRDHARRNGIRVEGTAWLGDRIRGGSGAGTGVGQHRPQRSGGARPPRVGRDASGEPKG